VLVAGGALLIVVATLLPSSQQPVGDAWCVVCGDLGGTDVLLNLLLFAPLGVGLGLLGTPVRRAAAALVVCTLAIELLQVTVIPGRDASLGDLLANSLGGMLSLVAARHSDSWIRPSRAAAIRLAAASILVWLGIQTTVSLSFRPVLPPGEWYGQLARELGGRPPWPGAVVEAAINGMEVPNTRIPQTAALRDSIETRREIRVDATVVPPAEAREWLASIVRVVNEDLDEAVLVAQRGTDLVVGVRTFAARLKLRRVMYRLPDAFPDDRARAGAVPAPGDIIGAVPPDTVRFDARYTLRRVTVRSESRGVARQLILTPTTGQGWRLVFPRQTYMDGSVADTLAAALWTALLLLPTGYWLRHAIAGAADNVRTTTVVAAAAVIVVGMVLPEVLGVAASSPELFAAAVGAAAGHRLGRIAGLRAGSSAGGRASGGSPRVE
jgi:hypothetical protein